MPTTGTVPGTRPTLDQQEKEYGRSAKLEHIRRAQDELSIQLTHADPEEALRITQKKLQPELDSFFHVVNRAQQDIHQKIIDSGPADLVEEFLASEQLANEESDERFKKTEALLQDLRDA